jgi:hypothetical protein
MTVFKMHFYCLKDNDWIFLWAKLTAYPW